MKIVVRVSYHYDKNDIKSFEENYKKNGLDKKDYDQFLKNHCRNDAQSFFKCIANDHELYLAPDYEFDGDGGFELNWQFSEKG